MIAFRHITVLILALTGLTGYSQTAPYHFEHLTVNDGISQGIVNDIHQDSYGFIWFATQDGLNLYDGYKIITYKHELHNGNSLGHNGVWDIYEDTKGRLWIGTYDGISLFNRDNKTFSNWRSDANIPLSLSNRAARTIGEDRHGNLWVGTYMGLNRFNKSKNGFDKYFHSASDSLSLSHNYITAIYLDSKGRLWIGTRQGLNLYDEKHDSFIRFLNNPEDPTSISDNTINSIHEDKKGNLWIGTHNGLNRLDPDTERFSSWLHKQNHPASLTHNHVTSVCDGPDGKLWVSTLEGLNLFDPSKEVFARWMHNPNDPRSLSLNALLKVYVGSGDILWIGTQGAGISKLNLQKQAFEHWSPSQLYGKTLSDYRIGPILIDNGFMWIGTASGLDVYRTDSTFQKYKSYRKDGAEGLSANYISVIYRDKSDNLWIGTDDGLNLFNRKSYDFDSWRCDKGASKGLGTNFIKSIREDKAGNLWVGTKKNLYHFNVEKKAFSKCNFDDKLSKIKSNGFESLFYDRSGNLWIGSGGAGLGQLMPDGQTIKWYSFDRKDETSISNNKIMVLHEDKSGNLWIGTRHGLNKYSIKDIKSGSGIFQRYTEKDGLCNNFIYGILEDDLNNLWITTSKGLAKFNPTTGVFRNYDVNDGLYSSSFEYGYYKDQNGKFYFGGLNGLTMFHPDKIVASNHLPPVRITDFRILNKPQPFSMSGIALDYAQNQFSFEFAALDYSASGKIQYAYQLEGLNDDWVYTQNDRTATFTQLSPGSYIFNVKASNREGIWTQSTSIPISIIPPWYRSIWAYILYVVLLAGAIMGIFWFRLTRLRLYDKLNLEHQQAEKWKELDRIKTNFFANITHEFRTPLTLILGPLQKLRQQLDKKKYEPCLDMIERNGYHLKTLIDQLLDLSKLEAHSMEISKRYGDIAEFISAQCELFQEVAERKGITFIVDITPDQLWTEFDDDKLHKILLNLLSNAFKYTSKHGKVFLVAEIDPEDKDQFKITVKDTGIGIEHRHLPHVFDRFYQANPSRLREGTGIGLALCKELAELQGGKIEVNSVESIGTEFIVYIPLDSYDWQRAKPSLLAPSQAGIDPREISSKFPKITKDMEASWEVEDKIRTTKQLVLVVDDNNDILQFVKNLLNDDGYNVLTATKALEGWQLAQSNIPDIIISDIVMDEMDGYDFCKLIKESKETSHIPVVLLTVKSALANKLNALSLGADVYLPKPFNADELLMHVKSLITLRKLLQVKYQKQIRLGDEVVTATSMEEEFLGNIRQQVKKHYHDHSFGVEVLAEEMNMSRSQLHRKLSALTGYTVVGFISSYRLQQAAQLLKQNAGTTADIAFKCGFSSPAYFTKKFTEEFGYPPKKIKKQLSQNSSSN